MSGLECILIDRGDLPGLVAAGLENDPSGLLIWHPLEPDAAADRRRELIEEHGRLFNARQVVVSGVRDLGLADIPPPTGMYQAQMLMGAAIIARQFNCRRIVWPHHVGPDSDAVAAAMERADLVSGLTDVEDETGEELAIDLPIVDLTDEQLVDLAEDQALPMRAWWPCEHSRPGPCDACASCQRWHAAFERAAVPWPWASVAV